MKNKTLKKSRLAALLTHEKWGGIAVPGLAIVLALITASILLLVMGKNPITAFMSFLQGSGILPKAKYGGGQGILTDLFNTMNTLAPMILASLSFIIGFKAGLFNIGIAGQMLISGFMATVIVGYSDLSSFIAKPLVALIGIITGGLVVAIIGWLKYKFNIHEVVASVMINYIISYGTGFFINSYYANMLTRSMQICSDEARLTLMNVQIGGMKCNVPLGIILAVAAAFIVKFIFDKTVFGFELKAVGNNATCAKYTGINVGRRFIFSMAFSGMLAGLAGVVYFLGTYNTILPKTLPGMGYDAIAVAMLGNASPVGAIFAAALISVFQCGSNYMSSNLGVAKEISDLITGILLMFSACGGYFRYMAQRRVSRERDQLKALEKAETEKEGVK
ncbi:MAG: ABC transporter permease [Oscillibacter sp.]|nr:ABC transporter permease [Oscillibacter sp.]